MGGLQRKTSKIHEELGELRVNYCDNVVGGGDYTATIWKMARNEGNYARKPSAPYYARFTLSGVLYVINLFVLIRKARALAGPGRKFKEELKSFRRRRSRYRGCRYARSRITIASFKEQSMARITRQGKEFKNFCKLMIGVTVKA